MGTTRERKDSTVRKKSCKRHSPRGVPFLIYQNADYNSVFQTYDK